MRRASRARRGVTTVGQRLTLLIAVVAVPIAVIVGFVAEAARDNARDAAARSTQQTAELAAAAVGTYVADVESQMRLLAERPVVSEARPGQCDPALNVIAETNPRFTNVAMVDLDGQLTCSPLMPEPGTGLPSAAATDWFRTAASSGGFTVGYPLVGKLSHRYVSVFVLALEANGRRTGYLAIPLDLARFGAVLDGRHGATHGTITVLTADGQIVARSADPARYVGQRLGTDQLRVLGQPTGEMVDGDGIRVTFAQVPIEGTSWTALAGIPTAIAYGDADRLGITLFTVTAVVMAIGLLAGAVTGSNIATSVRALATRAQDAASGVPSGTPSSGGPREVRETGAAIEAMARAQATATDERLELLERLVAAEDAERSRIAYQLHDDVVQQLAALSISVARLGRAVAADRIDHVELVAQIDDIVESTRGATESMRSALFDLAPAVSVDQLVSAIELLAERTFDGTSTVVNVAGNLAPLDLEQTALTYRIVAEALRNVRAHAAAGAVDVRLDRNGDDAVVSVVDNGRGVDPGGPRPRPGHLGVQAMGERAALLGGRCEIDRRPEGGTAVTLRFGLSSGAGELAGHR